MVTPGVVGGDYSNQRVQLTRGQRDGGASRDVESSSAVMLVPPPSPITADERRNPAALFNTLSTLTPTHVLLFFLLVPCVTNFTHFLSLSGIVKDLIRAFPALIVIRTVIVQAIKGNWATAEWKSPLENRSCEGRISFIKKRENNKKKQLGEEIKLQLRIV